MRVKYFLKIFIDASKMLNDDASKMLEIIQLKNQVN